MNDLPNGWTSCQLQDIVKTRKGKKPKILNETQENGLIPYLDIHAIEKNVFRQFADVQSSRIGTKDDIFIVWDGARSGWAGLGKDGAIGSTIMALETFAVEQNYLFYFLKSQFEYINSNPRGTGIPHVDPGIFNNIEVPLAPLNEQKRIVEKLEKLLGKVQIVQARLDKIPVILKRFRQAVLAAACSGKLTADWRENKEINLETDLPFDWRIVELQEYANCSRGRFSVRPRNDPRYFDGEYPFIQIGSIPFFGGYIDSHNQTLNEKGLGVSKMFPKGTVVIAIVGATIGNTGILAYDMCFTDSMVGIETGTEFGNKYVELFLRSKRDEIRQSSYAGGGQPNIKLQTLNPYPINLPPIEEQKEIVRRVEDLFKFADQIEARYQKARSYTDKLTQSILAKAFRGELVPQDDADEPAEILLERIKAEKPTDQAKAKAKKSF